MAAPVIQFKRGVFANLPGLQAGEPALTTDTFELYVGIDSTTNGNKFFGSHRYWSKGSASTGSGVNLVEGTSIGSDFITLKAPDTLAGITTYTFPASPINNNVLTTNANGVLSWTSAITELTISTIVGGIGTFSNNVAFTTTTNNTLGDENTGAVQLDGGMGIAKNLTVKENLSVGGFVEIVGAGVTINASGINVAAGIVTASRFVSNVLTGTAPISVASSTRVDNLNAQYVGGFGAPTSQVVGTNDTQTLTNKTIALGSNTVTGTLAEFNTALTDADFVSIAGTETLTNKTLTSPILTTPSLGIATATSINVSGIVTATTFVGALTGTATSTTNIPNLTGDITSSNTVTTLATVNSNVGTFGGTDSIPVVTVNGKGLVTGVSTVAPNNGALTLAVSGTGLSGSASFTANQSGASTFTVTSNATNANTASAIVARDASGNFSAGTITASLTGTATTTTNIPNLTGAITSVNTTTSLGSFSSANLSAALTDETGSGAAVFATSPTLVTPVLGAATGTSLNLGNINLESNGNATILGQLELGNASDTTLARSAAGVVTIEGVEVVTLSRTQTLTNKTLTSPTLTAPALGAATATSINVSGITTTGTLKLAGTPGIGITGISSSTSLTENSHTYLPTQAAVKAYVDAVDVTTSLAADSGSGSVSTSQTLTISGTANEVNTSASSQTITIGLPDSVTVTTALTTPTVNATNIKANDGTTAITITNSTGVVATNSDLTVGGNLYVNGSTTQVNTAALTVEDRTIELGIVNGAAPAGTTTWDLGVLFNYNSSGAKKSAVIWEQGDARFKFASVLAADTDGTDVNTPQLTVTTFAPIEIASLFVNDCAGASQVISCTGTTRNLENITIDAGTF